ncbi:MAG: DnaD domain protein [Ruminococcus sp.]|nr:DnaD domain protein [Ruminococcus sp.]
MEIKTNSIVSENVFEVPCVVVDTLLKVASGTYIKVLLYILRCSGKNCTQKEIASNTGVSLQEVEDAIQFWQQTNVLAYQHTNDIMPPVFDMTPPAVQLIANETVPESTSGQKTEIIIRKQKQWTGTEVSDLIRNNADFAELQEAVQSVLGTVNNVYISYIADMYNTLGMKKEVIMTLIGYCKDINKTYPDYIYAIACQWVRDNIDTLELATEEVQRLKASHDYMHKVMRTLEIDRLTEEQEKMTADWKNWSINMEMLKYAYEKSLPRCGNQLSIDYINGIIKRWHENGITTLQEAQENDELYKKKNNTVTNSTNPKKKNSDFNIDMYKIFVNDF